jgi:hypothetical protein
MIEAITLKESSRLIELEKIVVAGLQSWIEVGEALIEIRDSRLYRIEARTFEEYCQSRFKMGKAHAHRLMTAAPIAKDLSPIGDIPESVVREIAKVAPEKRQEVFQKATESADGHVPSARVIKQVVRGETGRIDAATRERVLLVTLFDTIDQLLKQSKGKGRRAEMRKVLWVVILDTLQKDEEEAR